MKLLFLKYWAHQLTLQGENRNINDLAATLNTARIDMNPYQLAAVKDCLRSLRENNGVILADEVGLGKTIEAGIIISKLWQSGKRRILIITPAWLDRTMEQGTDRKVSFQCKSHRQQIHAKEETTKPVCFPESQRDIDMFIPLRK